MTDRDAVGVSHEDQATAIREELFEVLPTFTSGPRRVGQRFVRSRIRGEEFTLEPDQLVDVAGLGRTNSRHRSHHRVVRGSPRFRFARASGRMRTVAAV